MTIARVLTVAVLGGCIAGAVTRGGSSESRREATADAGSGGNSP